MDMPCIGKGYLTAVGRLHCIDSWYEEPLIILITSYSYKLITLQLKCLGKTGTSLWQALCKLKLSDTTGKVNRSAKKTLNFCSEELHEEVRTTTKQ